MTTITRSEALTDIINSLQFFIPELLLTGGFIVILTLGLFARVKAFPQLFFWVGILTLVLSFSLAVSYMATLATPKDIFMGSLRVDDYSLYFRLLLDLGGILTLILSARSVDLRDNSASEYIALLLAATLGAHLLTMSTNFLVLFIALEMISIPSYVLAGFGKGKSAAEGSLKYFLFGAVASSIMVYGFSILYGLGGSIDFGSIAFVNLLNKQDALILVSGLMVLAGFLYKMGAAPLHPWIPDVYQASTFPVIAFFSVVPKLAGLAALSKFSLALYTFGQSPHDWQLILCVVAVLSLTIGNFSALWQGDPKRMMAYSSIAQSGFMVTGIATLSLQGYQFTLFYAAVYLISNFAVLDILRIYDQRGITAMQDYKGLGKSEPFGLSLLTIGLVALAGIPPTAGFMSKLFIFTGVWDTYASSGKTALLILLIFGLLNMVVSIFYYLKIPFYAFLRPQIGSAQQNTIPKRENYLAFILVIVVFILFLKPDLLMGWLNRLNFVL